MKDPKPCEEITIWKRLNHKTGEYEHNHIQEGWNELIEPKPKTKEQAKNWKSAKWKKFVGIIQDDIVYELGPAELQEAMKKLGEENGK